MSKARLLAIASAAVTLVAIDSARAQDRVTLLGGVGSLTTQDAATVTLKRVPNGDAKAQQVCWRGRWVETYPAYTYCAPAAVYVPPPIPVMAYPMAPALPYGTAPPAAPLQEPVSVAPAAPALARPHLAFAFTGRRISAAIAFTDSGIRVDAARPPAALPSAPRPTDQLPPPRPDDSFRYDGGPTSPVPLPDGGRPAPGAEEPQSAPTVPALHRVRALLNRRRATPPAAEPPARATPPAVDPQMVKNPPQK
jgi:hypothetical protein